MRTILKKTGRSTKSVHSNLKNSAGYLEKSPAKWPNSITPAMGRRLLRTLKTDRSQSSSNLKAVTLCVASARTIKRFFNQKRMKRIKRKQKPKISAKNKERRLQFAKDHQIWDNEWSRWDLILLVQFKYQMKNSIHQELVVEEALWCGVQCLLLVN